MQERWELEESVHGDINIFHRHLPMDLFHRCTCILHSHQRFLINICGFDRVDLLLQHRDLTVGLLERVLVLLLTLESVACHCGFANQHRPGWKVMAFQKFITALNPYHVPYRNHSFVRRTRFIR